MKTSRAVVVGLMCAVGTVLFMTLDRPASAQVGQTASPSLSTYRALRAFALSGSATRVDKLVLKRDRGEMTFSGTFYFAKPVDGLVAGAVFIGQGTFRAAVPPSRFELDNVKRLLNTDAIESDFQTAVLRFADDTFGLIRGEAVEGQVPPEAAGLASEFEGRLLRETGINLASRLAVAVLNKESPAPFFAQFDKGRRNRFSFLVDYQSRIPVANFGLDGGEKGLIFAYRKEYIANEVWMAFYAMQDYAAGQVEYSDVHDLVKTAHYNMDIDLREPAKRLAVTARMTLTSMGPGLAAVPMSLGESLREYDNQRLEKALRVKSATLAGGGPIEFAQEDWEGGFTLFLPSTYQKGDRLTVEVRFEGDFLQDVPNVTGNHYPLSNQTWYPRHGYLERSTFDMVFHHTRNLKVVASGTRVREAADPAAKNEMVTEFAMDVPVALVSFAIGPFERLTEKNDPSNGPDVPIELYAMPMSIANTQTPFILAEMMNSLNYFSALFGQYPYPVFRAAVHPYGFGQGLATLLMIPPTDRADRNTFAFIAHETSHQWWGHAVLWRSYRDQWLSEGFAEYSGLLYTTKRDGADSAHEMLRDLRESLTAPPRTALGVGSGRLTDVGPIIMGRRLASRETVNAYTTLIYNKGALVLRMLHFLFTDPSSGNGQPFFDMMRNFVATYRNRSATTDEFIAVANEHFATTPIAKRFGLQDLNWFFRQWLFQTYLPSYRLEYSIQAQPDKTFLLKGVVFQEGVPEGEKWFMPLPLVLKFGGGKTARPLAYALGPRTEISIKLPAKPDGVELDPDWWVASDKTKAVKK